MTREKKQGRSAGCSSGERPVAGRGREGDTAATRGRGHIDASMSFIWLICSV